MQTHARDIINLPLQSLCRWSEGKTSCYRLLFARAFNTKQVTGINR